MDLKSATPRPRLSTTHVARIEGDDISTIGGWLAGDGFIGDGF